MAVIRQITSALSSVTVSGLGTLASGTYIVSPTIVAVTNGLTDLDNIVEVAAATTNTPTGRQQLLIYAQASFDGGTTWQSGPTSGTDTTNARSLTLLGAVPMRSVSTTHRRPFNIAQYYGGVMPPHYRLVFQNDLGVAMTSASVAVARITQDVT